MRYLLLLSMLLVLWACEPTGDRNGQAMEVHVAEAGVAEVGVAEIRVADAMSGDVPDGFKRVTGPREFSFPLDHGAHPEYATEWWYLTGNLFAEDGRRFGYQVTIFRVGMSPPGERADDSAWRAGDLYMGHLAITDVDGREHHSRERFARGAAGLAGASLAPFRVWLNHWQLAGSDALFPLRVQADEPGLALDLVIDEGIKNKILQGDRGYSKKGLELGNASYYYSHTRLPTRGSLRVGQQHYAVTGNSWLDREWSSSALEADQEGWDWLSLQLDDGRDLMLYHLRKRGGGSHPMSAGVLVDPAGNAEPLKPTQFDLRATRRWQSDDGRRYPVDWQVSLPAHGLDLTVTAVLDDQTMDHTVRYWEGAVDVTGSVDGVGYLELSGY